LTEKPLIGYEPTPQKKINAGTAPVKKHWRFSFRYWKQIEYFGLNKSKPSWFVSLLEKLVDYSKEELDIFLTDSKKRSTYRFHEINWSQPGIPIKRADLNWVDKQYLDNNDEFRFYQFQVTSGLGRVVGFFDETKVFNIVLLDPLHNAQPTKFNKYKVKECSPLPNDFAILVATIQKIADRDWCHNGECSMRSSLHGIRQSVAEPGVIIMNLSEEIYKRVLEVMDTEGIGRLEDFFQYGIMFFEDQTRAEEEVTS
jgi:hypothetical protein